jgi:hypothetical protein
MDQVTEEELWTDYWMDKAGTSEQVAQFTDR